MTPSLTAPCSLFLTWTFFDHPREGAPEGGAGAPEGGLWGPGPRGGGRGPRGGAGAPEGGPGPPKGGRGSPGTPAWAKITKKVHFF